MCHAAVSLQLSLGHFRFKALIRTLDSPPPYSSQQLQPAKLPEAVSVPENQQLVVSG